MPDLLSILSRLPSLSSLDVTINTRWWRTPTMRSFAAGAPTSLKALDLRKMIMVSSCVGLQAASLLMMHKPAHTLQLFFSTCLHCQALLVICASTSRHARTIAQLLLIICMTVHVAQDADSFVELGKLTMLDKLFLYDIK